MNSKNHASASTEMLIFAKFIRFAVMQLNDMLRIHMRDRVQQLDNILY